MKLCGGGRKKLFDQFPNPFQMAKYLSFFVVSVLHDRDECVSLLIYTSLQYDTEKSYIQLTLTDTTRRSSSTDEC